MTALDSLLDRLPRISLVVGKGGVGKTTCATAIAARFAQRGERTLLVSTDPAAALSDVIGAVITTATAPVPGQPNLDARQLSAPELRTDFLNRWRDTIADIIDRGTYLDRDDVDGLVDAALPGVDETFALLALADLLDDPAPAYARIVVDTAPTGHTLRLLALPQTFSALLSIFDVMQQKHRFMVRALTHRYRRDRADDFIDEMRGRIDRLRATLADARALAAALVTRDEAIVAAESRRYLESLRGLHVHVSAIIINAVAAGAGEVNPAEARADAAFASNGDIPRYWIPRAAAAPRGLEAVVSLVGRATATGPARPKSARSGSTTDHPSRSADPSSVDLSTLTRVLTVVGGKGGVGKTTVACALAIAAADRASGVTLLVSTDPAPSIADAFGASTAAWARADVEAEIEDVPGLVVRQMDATGAFARIRDTYQTRIDTMINALVGRSIDVEHDRAIVRDLLALAPPGIDELFALSILGDALTERRFARLIVDPAPTGHLLRLLEMPAIALDWTHRLMRLMLKYRDIIGLGDTAQELLDFTKRTRALDALLHDPARCGVMIVALDEPVVRDQTVRLASAVDARDINVSAIVWNRVARAPAPLPATRAVHQYFAEEVQPPPIGVPALRAWARSWGVASPDS